MDQGPLVTEQIEAGARFLGEFNKYVPVQGAFWFKGDDEKAWWLYVFSDSLTHKNIHDGYGVVVRVAGQFNDPSFDMLQVKLIPSDDSLAKAAADVRQRYPGQSPIRQRNRSFGGVWVEEVYLYPLPLPEMVH